MTRWKELESEGIRRAGTAAEEILVPVSANNVQIHRVSRAGVTDSQPGLPQCTSTTYPQGYPPVPGYPVPGVSQISQLSITGGRIERNS
eukprot:1571960-Rhodomonas_salina.1